MLPLTASVDLAPLNEEERAYLAVHRPRYAYVVRLVQRLLLRRSSPGRPRLLDVGPHFLTALLRTETAAVVDQLGFRFDRVSQPRGDERHFEFDLNETSRSERWPQLPAYDVIVAAEVIEHLHTSPRFVLGFLANALAPEGHLIVQTPNAVALKRRLAMLAGRNPYELIRDTPSNPGHFREYTRAEVLQYAGAVGLELVEFESRAYFDYRADGAVGHAYGALLRVLPATLRDGMTFVFRRRSSFRDARI